MVTTGIALYSISVGLGEIIAGEVVVFKTKKGGGVDVGLAV